MTKIRKLFEPANIGKVELKNRIVMLAMTTGLPENYRVSDRLIDFFTARAKGGVGLVTVGTVFPSDFDSVEPVYKPNLLGIGIWSDEFIPGLRALTKAIHDNGAKACCQLMLCYEWRLNRQAPLEAVGPSEGSGGAFIPRLRALTTKEIHKIVEQFGDGARRAREAGFDMVEFQSGMGYFINRFLSSRSNNRTDEYGGPLDNRMRFLLDIIECSKERAGSDYTYICRISADEFIDGGNTLNDTKKIVPILQGAGIAAINVQAGWHESPRPLVQQWVPAGAFAYLAEEVKKVTNLPVIAAYRIDDPLLAEEIVTKQKADLIGMARALIADAEFPNKARDGRLHEIRPCIACCRCIENNLIGLPIACSVNAGLEITTEEPIQKRKRVLVVGGGPAGMEAARVAAARGHQVILCDKGRRLGGLLLLAAVLNDKLEGLTRWMVGQIEKLPIEVKLKMEVTPELIRELNPDIVIIAPGGEPIIPEVPGIVGENVITGRDLKSLLNGSCPKISLMWRLSSLVAKYLGGKPTIIRTMLRFGFPIKKRVIILGGQFAGCELALTLMEKEKKITILEESKHSGSDIGPVSRWVEIQMLRKGGVRIETEAEIKEVTHAGVKAVLKGTKEVQFEADTVLVALGLRENTALADQIKGSVHLVGDASGGGGIKRIMEAIASGFELANRI